MQKFFILLYGVLFFFPLGALPRFGFVKIDDLLLIGLLLFFVVTRGVNFRLLAIVTLVLSVIIFNLINSSLGREQFDILMRATQCALLVVFASYTVEYRRNLVSGFLIGGVMTSLIFYYNLIFLVDHTSILVSLYAVKDYYTYINTDVFSIHINTVMVIVMACFILSFARYQSEAKARYILLMLFFIMVLILSVAKNALLSMCISFCFLYVLRSKAWVKSSSLYILALSAIPLYVFISNNLDEIRIIASNRFEIYSSAIKLIIENPFGNVGLGMQSTAINSVVGLNYPAHNALLSVGLEFGFFYAVSFFWILILLFIKTNRIYSVLFLAFILTGMLSNLLYFYKYHFLMLALAWFYSVRVPTTDGSV